MNNNGMKKVELNVGPQINFADAVESIEINDRTKIVYSCCYGGNGGGFFTLKSFLIGLIVISVTAAVGKTYHMNLLLLILICLSAFSIIIFKSSGHQASPGPEPWLPTTNTPLNIIEGIFS